MHLNVRSLISKISELRYLAGKRMLLWFAYLKLGWMTLLQTVKFRSMSIAWLDMTEIEVAVVFVCR